MAGRTMPLFNKILFDFNQLTAGQSESHIKVKSTDVNAYKEGLWVGTA